MPREIQELQKRVGDLSGQLKQAKAQWDPLWAPSGMETLFAISENLVTLSASLIEIIGRHEDNIFPVSIYQ
jgi:hypothetical protein